MHMRTTQAVADVHAMMPSAPAMNAPAPDIPIFPAMQSGILQSQTQLPPLNGGNNAVIPAIQPPFEYAPLPDLNHPAHIHANLPGTHPSIHAGGLPQPAKTLPFDHTNNISNAMQQMNFGGSLSSAGAEASGIPKDVSQAQEAHALQSSKIPIIKFSELDVDDQPMAAGSFKSVFRATWTRQAGYDTYIYTYIFFTTGLFQSRDSPGRV
jgi:hypothetical protein